MSLVVLAVLYSLAAHHISGYRSFWSPDGGARFAMIRNWVEHGSLVYLQYDNQSVDPEGRLHPLGAYLPTSGFLVRLPRGFTTIYQPLFVLVSGAAYRCFGFGGLFLLPVLGGLAASFVTYLLARRLRLRLRLALPLLLGLCTPLAIYSVVFWDHSIHMLLVAAAAYGVLRSIQDGNGRWAVAAGLSLGLGVWFHELLGAMAVAGIGAALALLRGPDRRRVAGGLALGLAPLVVGWLLANWMIYGVAGGPHGVGPNSMTSKEHLAQILSPRLFAQRSLLEFLGDRQGRNAVVMLGLLIGGYAAAACSRRWGRKVAAFAWLPVAVVAFASVQNSFYANGLFQATPLLVPAVGAFAYLRRGTQQDHGSAEAAFYRWAVVVCALYAAAVVANPLVPGLEWGSRYLVIALPLALVLAARVVEDSLASLHSVWRVLPAVAYAGLAGVSLYSEVTGFSTISAESAYKRWLADTARSIDTPVMVTDIWDMGAYTALAPLPHAHYLVSSKATVAQFYGILERQGVQRFTFFGNGGLLPGLYWYGRQLRHPFVVTKLTSNRKVTAAFVRADRRVPPLQPEDPRIVLVEPAPK